MGSFFITAITFMVFDSISFSCADDLTFPPGFQLGVATAAYQIEGAWNVSDKGVSVCDTWTHNKPQDIVDQSNGDIACNSYYEYKQDVANIKALGFDYYRFSISWTRVLPSGFKNKISKDGLQYYKNLVKELIDNGIEPVVTIYHWDHPQVIEDMGGWTNELMVDWFVDFAEVMFEALGDKVKRWITINEPDSFCFGGYQDTKTPPAKVIPNNMAGYICGHNVLKAHAKTYHMYDKKFRATQQGHIGIVLSCAAYVPADPMDKVSSDRGFQFYCGWMAHPIFVGDYPEIMKTRIAMISKIQGYEKSRLPELSDEWISIINGTADYFGLNHYGSNLVSLDPDEKQGIYNTDMGLLLSYDPSWPQAASSWLHVNPSGFGDVLRKIRDEYRNPPVWVMENGYSDTGEFNDQKRIKFYHDYLIELLKAIKKDGCNVKGYTVWSIIDNFEWYAGYTERFGIFTVNFNDPRRTRSGKVSALWWNSVLSSRRIRSVTLTHEERSYSGVNNNNNPSVILQ